MNISSRIQQLLREENGVLTFEWLLLGLLLTIGIIGGLAAMRDVQVLQFANVADAAASLNQSCGWNPTAQTQNEGENNSQTRCLYLKNSHVEDVSRQAGSDEINISKTQN